MDLKNIGAVITGGSRGLGAALAKELARSGARVALIARGGDELEAVAREIRAGGGVAHAIPGDVADKRAIYPLAGAAAALVGPVSLVIHNASTLGPTPLPLLLDTECEDLEAVLAVNLVGPFRLTKALSGAMALGGGGLVVSITSDASVSTYARWGAYSIAKAALDHMARIFAVELEGTGVRFLTVDPGEMNTRMHADAMPEVDPATLPDPSVSAARIVAMIRHANEIPSGARIEAATWRTP